VSPVRFLLDTSAFVRILRNVQVRERWEPLITAGLVAVCPAVELEILRTARSQTDREEILDLLGAAFVWVPMPDRVFTRAGEVQVGLTGRGTHRSASAVDLLVAAAAELQGLTLVHFDHDFDQVVAVTGQAAVWLAAAGMID
jgi:predicted nucleic acid-binding protein